MSFTYANRANHPMIETNRAAINGVTGWIVYNYNEQVERLYAVNAKGEVKCTNWLKMPNDHFNKVGRVWHVVGGPVPDDAVYCGNYAADMF